MPLQKMLLLKHAPTVTINPEFIDFDRDGDFIIYTSIPGCHEIRHDLRKGKTDMFQLNTAFSNKLLGGGYPSDKVAGVNQYKGHVDMGGGLFGGGNARPLDRAVVEATFRSNPRILQSDEYVEMAFKGRRDLVIFTTKRIIDVDVKGWSGKKVRTCKQVQLFCIRLIISSLTTFFTI